MSQQNKTTLQAAINTQLADNSSNDISAADVRDNLINMTDSLLFNSGSQSFTGALTATSFTGSLQGTASYATVAQTLLGSVTSASYAATASIANVSTQLTITGAGGVGTLYPTLVGISAGNLNVSTKASNLSFSQTTNQLFATSISSSFTGSLQGTASYATQALSASWAPSTGGTSFPYTGSALITGSLGITGSLTQQNGSVSLGFPATFNRNLDIWTNAGTDNVVLSAGDSSNKPYKVQLNPVGSNLLIASNDTSILMDDLTDTITISGSVLLDKGITGSLQGTATAAVSASYAATSSLSDATIGAGDAGNINGGEVQFRGNTTSLGGKNTYSSAFIWDTAYNGLLIADPNTTYTQNGGYYYLQVGTNVISAGNYAVSFGSSSYAQSEGSFTHGKAVTAYGTYSHAEGVNTQAQGNYSHAEGNLTTAWGIGSHAEGFNTMANSDYSRTEGTGTSTNGYGSHAEGSSTTTIGINSHAEGANTLASASYSHAEGRLTVSRGQYSHTEGFYTTASGIYSHAEGSGSIALGIGSHAEGQFTIASGSYQHVEGRFNTQGDNTSLMIVGNGTSNTSRQDAFKVRQSGSIVLPTTQSAAPSWTGTDGEIVPATVGGGYFLYMWMNGAWRSGSFV